MIYLEFQLCGIVKAYEMTEAAIMIRTTTEARAEWLPLPMDIDDAHEFIRAGCFQLEMFDTIEHAESWADSYGGFRAGEARAELARFQARRAQQSADTIAAA